MAARAVVQSLLILIFLVMGCLRDISARKGRILGGFETDISEAPYIVRLHHNGAFSGAGTLISDRFVLTAAHCVHNRKAKDFEVVGGSNKLYDGGVRCSVDLIIMPPTYDPVTMDMDVAVLRLSALLTGRNIKTIPLCSRPMPVGAVVKISGWGLLSESSRLSQHLRSVEVPVKSKDECELSYYPEKLTDSKVCAGEPGKDSCQGDSGGPVVWNNEVCAVVSYGIGCAKNNFPGINTDVYAVRKFIIDAIKNNS